jgi:hypothetical protein
MVNASTRSDDHDRDDHDASTRSDLSEPTVHLSPMGPRPSLLEEPACTASASALVHQESGSLRFWTGDGSGGYNGDANSTKSRAPSLLRNLRSNPALHLTQADLSELKASEEASIREAAKEELAARALRFTMGMSSQALCFLPQFARRRLVRRLAAQRLAIARARAASLVEYVSDNKLRRTLGLAPLADDSSWLRYFGHWLDKALVQVTMVAFSPVPSLPIPIPSLHSP